jgi:hypothetical protein
VVIVVQLAAKLQVQLAAKLVDALTDVLGLQLQIFIIVKCKISHTDASLLELHTHHYIRNMPK